MNCTRSVFLFALYRFVLDLVRFGKIGKIRHGLYGAVQLKSTALGSWIGKKNHLQTGYEAAFKGKPVLDLYPSIHFFHHI